MVIPIIMWHVSEGGKQIHSDKIASSGAINFTSTKTSSLASDSGQLKQNLIKAHGTELAGDSIVCGIIVPTTAATLIL